MSTTVDIVDRMDPELRQAFVQFPPLDPFLADVAKSRRLMAEGAWTTGARPAPSPTVQRRDTSVPGPAGAPRVPVRIYEPRERDGRLPAILYLHGGGFIVGTLDYFDPTCEHLVDAVDTVVVSVDYRLMPEHVYPAAVEDCYAALRWLFGAADDLGVDEGRIAVAGSSAGGTLTAAVALLARDRGDVPVAFQMPLSAVLDDRHETPSSFEVTDPRCWNRESSIVMWRTYLGPAADTGDVSPYAAPARAEDLAGLPPAYLSVGDLELMRDENVDYARRLVEAGVPTEFHLYPGAFHGFESMVPSARVSRDAVDSQDRALRRVLHPA